MAIFDLFTFPWSFLARLRQSPRAERTTPRTHHVEPLEARIAPATLVIFDGGTGVLSISGDFVDNGTLASQPGASETLTLSLSGNLLLINDPAHGVTLASGGTGLAQSTPNTVTVDLNLFTGSYDIDTGTGADSVTLNAAITFAPSRNLEVDTVGPITLGSASQLTFVGTGSVFLTTTTNIVANPGSSISIFEGQMQLSANTADTAVGNFTGIDLNGTTLTTSGDGAITLTGIGGVGPVPNMFGIHVHGNTVIQSTSTNPTAGNITLIGTGGDGVGGTGLSDRNYGVEIGEITSAAVQTKITSVRGSISITGTGGSGPGVGEIGIDVRDGAQILSTGTGGSITLTGQGGTNVNGDSNPGINITHTNNSTSTFGTLISSVDGTITLNGTGGVSPGGSNVGIAITNGAKVASTGLGNVALTGIGGNSSGNDTGVLVSGAYGATSLATVGIHDGILTLTATAGNNLSLDLNVQAGGTLIGDGGADMIFFANTVNFAGDVSLITSLHVATRTPGLTVNLGGLDIAGNTLGLGVLDLRHLLVGNILLGESGTNPIVISDAVTLPGSTGLDLTSNSAGIRFTQGTSPRAGSITADGTVALRALNNSAIVIDAATTPQILGGANVVLVATAEVNGSAIGSAANPFAVSTTGTLSTDSSTVSGSQFLQAVGTVQVGAGSLNTGAGPLHLLGGTFTLTSSSLLNATLFIDGATLDLQNFNPTTFGLTLNSGSLNGAGNLTVSSATLVSGTVNAHLISSGNVLKTGSGAVSLNASNSLSSGVLISQGTVRFSDPGAFGNSFISLNDGNTGANDTALLATASFAAGTFLNLIFVSNVGTGTVTLGTAVFDAPNPTVFNGAIALSKDVTLMGGSTGGTVFNDVISGAGVTKSGMGPVTLAAANTYIGATTITAGQLNLTSGLALQNSTVTVTRANALTLDSSVSDYFLGGLAGSGALTLPGVGTLISNLHVGGNNSSTTYSGVLSGLGSLIKEGTGTLTLTGKNTYSGGTQINAGILRVSANNNLGDSDAGLAFTGGALDATKTFTTARPINFMSNTGTLMAEAGKTLTVKGVLSGTGNVGIAGAGKVNIVPNALSTNSGGMSLDADRKTTVNGVSVSAPGSKGGIMIMPGDTPGEIDLIDLSAAIGKINLNIKGKPGGVIENIERIVDMSIDSGVKSITIGKGVVLGDGMGDGTADLMILGTLGKLKLDDVNANTIIDLGGGLPYTAPNKKDTYHNKPNVTIGDVMGPGVMIDVTGDGMASGVGGGGLGKVIVNTWSDPGVIMTTQGITSIIVKQGDFGGDVQVDPDHLGAFTVANIGMVSIPEGRWTGAGLQVEGVVAQFLTKGIAQGTVISAGAFGSVSIKGTYEGSVIALADPSVKTGTGAKVKIVATGDIASVSIAGDFTGLISGEGKVGNVALSGSARFMGTLQGGSLANVTAASFSSPGAARQTITSATSIGNIVANLGGLADYIIAAGTDLGKDHAFGGGDDLFTGSYLSGGKDLAAQIASVTIKGDVSGTTIAAGIVPGAMGVYGGSDTAAPSATGIKSKLGPLKFGGTALSVDAAPKDVGAVVGNAFEAGSMTSIILGAGKTVVTTRTFDATQYLNGSDPLKTTIIRKF